MEDCAEERQRFEIEHQEQENPSKNSDMEGCAEERQRFEIEHQEQESRSKIATCKSWLYASRNLIGAMLARLLFLAVAVVCTAIAVASTTRWELFLLFLPLVLFIVEAFYMFKYRKNKEWKWGTPCIFAFLLCSVPAIWVLQHQSIVSFQNKNNSSGTECGAFDSLVENITLSVDGVTQVAEKAHDMCICIECVPILVQALLLVLILGRWLLPKAKGLTDDQKAQLLLVNIAVAADILDLFELLNEPKVHDNAGLVYAVLVVWSASLLQYGIVATATTEKGWMCFQSEMWALITLLCLDDLSFLILRVVFMAAFDVISYSSYFFTAKNAIVLFLDLNRIFALYQEEKKRKSEPNRQKPTRLTHIRR